VGKGAATIPKLDKLFISNTSGLKTGDAPIERVKSMTSFQVVTPH